MKTHYSYFIIKPDGIKFINEILEEIDKNNFDSINFYAINDFETIIKKLYHKHYESKKEGFIDNFDSYLYGLKNIYNNYGVLILVGDSNESYLDLTKKVYDTKIKIRNKYTNNNIGIATNVQNGKENSVQILSKDGKNEKLRCLTDSGFHRISDLNIIHSPDPDVETTLDELKILFDNNVLCDKNMLDRSMFTQIVKYKTNNFLQDMEDTSYEGIVSPNISGFSKSQVEKDLEK